MMKYFKYVKLILIECLTVWPFKDPLLMKLVFYLLASSYCLLISVNRHHAEKQLLLIDYI